MSHKYTYYPSLSHQFYIFLVVQDTVAALHLVNETDHEWKWGFGAFYFWAIFAKLTCACLDATEQLHKNNHMGANIEPDQYKLSFNSLNAKPCGVSLTFQSYTHLGPTISSHFLCSKGHWNWAALFSLLFFKSLVWKYD